MKKVILAGMLVITGIMGKVFAQYDPPYQQLSKSDQLFNVSNSQWLRHNFIIQLTKGNQVIIKLANKNVLEKIMNLDSLLIETLNKILLIRDSFTNELTNKRIDLALGNGGISKMRFIEYQPKGSSYAFQNKELVALKVEQDTISITGYYTNEKAARVARRGIYFYEPYQIIILLNNLPELKGYLDGRINKAMLQLKNDWDEYKNWSEKKNWNSKLYALYNTADEKSNIKFGTAFPRRKTITLDPAIQVNLQNVRNIFGPSVSLGIDLHRITNRFDEHFQLLWEPYFFFEKNNLNKTVLMRNDFITIQYRNIRDFKPWNEKQSIKYYQQFSLGWLAHRDGEYFEKNTFKIGFPGFQYHNMMLAPDFQFHDLFKQFTPSLKLSVIIE